MLDNSEMRFTELRQRMGGASQKMLTKRYRQMERSRGAYDSRQHLPRHRVGNS